MEINNIGLYAFQAWELEVLDVQVGRLRQKSFVRKIQIRSDMRLKKSEIVAECNCPIWFPDTRLRGAPSTWNHPHPINLCIKSTSP
jgi:hypothetical protein